MLFSILLFYKCINILEKTLTLFRLTLSSSIDRLKSNIHIFKIEECVILSIFLLYIIAF